jgi:phage shock protein A
MIPHDFFGTLPQWLTLGSVASLLGIVVRYRLGLRKMSVEAQEVQVHAKTADNTNSADIRDHYAQEVGRLTERVVSIEADHEQCKRERDQYRAEVSTLDDKLRGVTRQFVALQMETMKTIPPENLTPTIKKMLEKLQEVAEGRAV